MNAEFYSRLEWRRFSGFKGFTANKAFAVSDAVPQGSLWLLFAISAWRILSTAKTVHVFAIPSGDAPSLINPSADSASPFFLGPNNNPPLKSGVLLSLGGNNAVPSMQTGSGISIQGLMAPFPLPQGWKLLASIDSVDTVIAGDQLNMDVALIEVASDECLPDFL